MKKTTQLYILSLLLIAVAIFLSIEYQNAGRLQAIAGILITFGFIANIIAFALRK